MAKHVLDSLKNQFGDAILATHEQLGNETAVVAPEALVEIAQFLKTDPQLLFNMPIDCTAVDYWQRRKQRFEVIWHLYSLSHKFRLRLKVQLSEAACECASLTPVWPGFNWFEREAWDLYGIRFVGHPNLRRVLMYEEFVGHPLRKDYPIDKRQPLIAMRPVRDIPTQKHAPAQFLNRP